MPKQSAGLLVYRRRNGQLEVFLVHPGGPFWQHKDQGAWSIPKGEFAPDDDPLEAAKREFHEETGFRGEGPFQALQPLKQPSGKVVHAWLMEGDFDPREVCSNTFKLEWPRNSRKFIDVPEVDRAGWFPLEVAREKILPGQRPFLDQLEAQVIV
ncbi:MAG TPA: NUDIX domain-containing protein [Lacipirellulaceae bacterium]